ncbi:unnamed protein product [Rotaria sp. Silwood2]|nr:unnamed protein product [Rotaria sp. Silwood2]
MNNISLTKEMIKQLIQDDDKSLTFVKPKTASSHVWKKYSYIYVSNKKQDFVSCDEFKEVLHHISTDGTSSMIKHQKSCQGSHKNNQHESFTIKEYFRPKISASIPRAIKEKITNAAVELVSLDNRAFELISGDGFINFAQTVLDVGQNLSNKQNHSIADFLPHPTTVKKRIQDVWTLQNIHYISTFLHPSMKNFHINPDLHEKAIELVQQEILKRKPASPSNTFETVTTTPIRTNAPDSQPTTSKGLLSYCFDIPETDFKSTSTSYDELKEYMALDVQLTEDDNILEFWLQQKSKFPVLFSIVQDFYAVPASNTTIERLFSSSKNTITDKRSSLGAEKLNQLLFLQKNLKLLNSFDNNNSVKVNDVEVKRKMDQQSSSTILNTDDEQSITTATKKFKKNEDDVTLIGDD